jgi:uncharacterized protein YegL
MKTKIYNLIILDESGSMESIKSAALNSVNESLQSIRHAHMKYEEQEHYVTFVTFNNDVKTLFDCVSIDMINDLTPRDYNPNCCTALYDAMGMSLGKLRRTVAKDDKVLVTIVTDGYENVSREYSAKAIKALVEELKSKGWVFAYMGANQDVEAVGASLAISNTLSFAATDEGTHEMSCKMKKGRSRLFDSIAYCCFEPEAANKSFFKEEDDEQ